MFFDQGTIFILTCWGVDKPANQKIGYQFPLLHSPNMLCKPKIRKQSQWQSQLQ